MQPEPDRLSMRRQRQFERPHWGRVLDFDIWYFRGEQAMDVSRSYQQLHIDGRRGVIDQRRVYGVLSPFGYLK